MPKGNSPSQGYNQNKSPFDVVRNSVNQAYSITKDAFKNLGGMLAQTPEAKALQQFASTPVPQYNNQYVPAQNIPQFYQVRQDDASMDDIAQRSGVPLQQLTELNRTKTLPPVGSYIQLRTPAPGSVNAALGLSGNANAFGGGSRAVFNTANRGDPAAQALRNQAAQITAQIMAGNDPQQIPTAVVGFIKKADGTSLTIQDLLAEGYVMNAQGVMVKAGVGPGGTAPSADFMATQAYQNNVNVPFLNQLRYDPETKK